MEIETTSELGFCFGVRRAIDMVETAAREKGAVESLGDIVHNRQVVQRLACQGVRVVQSLDQLQGKIVAISSHGVGPEVFAQIKARGLEVINTTCPFVRKAQTTARRLRDAGSSVIIFGDRDHPEVQGLLGWAAGKGMATVDPKLASRFAKKNSPVCILSQTTQSPDSFSDFVKKVTQLASPEPAQSSLTRINTICPPTRKRYRAALELARRVDLMLVVGGHHSANTKRLAELCSAAGVETHHIETAANLNLAWLNNRHRVGVTAGASTPDEAINEVILKLEERAPG